MVSPPLATHVNNLQSRYTWRLLYFYFSLKSFHTPLTAFGFLPKASHGVRLPCCSMLLIDSLCLLSFGCILFISMKENIFTSSIKINYLDSSLYSPPILLLFRHNNIVEIQNTEWCVCVTGRHLYWTVTSTPRSLMLP